MEHEEVDEEQRGYQPRKDQPRPHREAHARRRVSCAHYRSSPSPKGTRQKLEPEKAASDASRDMFFRPNGALSPLHQLKQHPPVFLISTCLSSVAPLARENLQRQTSPARRAYRTKWYTILLRLLKTEGLCET